MIKNYIKIAWRNIVKGRLYSMVNMLGLSAGITFCMLVAGYVWSELEVNNNIKNADRQFILQSKWKDPNMGLSLTTLGPLAKTLKEKYPGLVANYYRWDGVTSTVSKDNKAFREGIQICDSTMFNMYGFHLKYGNPSTAFVNPYSVIITTEKAMKYFGKPDVVGQTLSIENFADSRHDFTITGVMVKPNKNSITLFTPDNNNQFYIAEKNLSYFGRNMGWDNPYIVGYVELQKNVGPADLEKPLSQLLLQHTNMETSVNLKPYLLSLKDFYRGGGAVDRALYTLSAIAIFILLMAIINFINMSISRSASRMKEIGIRKVLGSLKKQLIFQFLTESIILVFFATLLAIIIYPFSSAAFGQLIGTEIPTFKDFPLYFIIFPVLLVIFVGCAAGFYPALILSSLRPVSSLKGKFPVISNNLLLRKSLVVFQYSIACTALVCAIIVSAQVNLFFTKDPGFNKEYIISAQVPRNWSTAGVQRMEITRRIFTELPQVKSATLSYEVPAEGGTVGSAGIYRIGYAPNSAIVSQLLSTDEYYATTYGIAMAAGVFFCSPGSYSDPFTLVINEMQAKAFGWKNAQEAIGQKVRFNNNPQPYTITGVTKDFFLGSIQDPVHPVTFMHVNTNTQFRYLSFKISHGNIISSIAAIQKKWNEVLPGTPFEYVFVDDTLKMVYAAEIQLKRAAFAATALSLAIVLLGVTGLISLNIQKRTKEIGIRKVLGSSVSAIMYIFLKEFVTIIAVAALISFPAAWLLMEKWLHDYVYKVSITAMPFLVSLLTIAFITAILIVTQTIKTALANPVKSLRTE